MNKTANSTVSDGTVRLSRRGSLRVAGTAPLVSVTNGSNTVHAGKRGKNANKRCRKQGDGYAGVVRDQRAGNETCLQALLPCCALLTQCKGRDATVCFLSG